MSNLEYFFCLSKEGSVLQFYFACSRKSLKGLRASRFYRGVIRFVYCFYSLGRIAIPVIELRYVSQYLRPREEFEFEVVNCSFVKRDTTLILRPGSRRFYLFCIGMAVFLPCICSGIIRLPGSEVSGLKLTAAV
jgi:hypothetical protein